jgi:hypothetical protein
VNAPPASERVTSRLALVVVRVQAATEATATRIAASQIANHDFASQDRFLPLLEPTTWLNDSQRPPGRFLLPNRV